MKSNIECSAIYLGKHAYKMFLSRYDNRSSQWVKWEETSSHNIKISSYSGFMVDYQESNLPIFRLDGTFLPLLKQVTEAQYYKKGYSGENLDKAGCSVKTLVMKFKNKGEVHLHEFKIPSGGSYGSIETLEIKDYAHFDNLNQVSN